MAKFDNSPVDNDPLAYNSASGEFTANTDDISLINLATLKIYSVEVEFTTYPRSTYSTVAINEASSTIEFINPCLIPFTFVSAVQD